MTTRTWDLRSFGIGLALSVLPMIFVFVTLEIRQMMGPGWLATSADPEYLHFMNAALVGNSEAPAHTDNPGTPLHLIGGAVLRIQHAIYGRGNFLDDVVTRPEWYLGNLRAALACLTAAAFFAAGVIVQRTSGSLFAALLVQLSPWCFWSIPSSARFVSPESLLNGFAALFSAVFLVTTYYRSSSEYGHVRRNTLLLGGIAGLSIATKVTALPLVIAPLVALRSYRDRLFFVVVTVLAFCVGTAPILDRIARLFFFIARNITHTGQYGSGPPGFHMADYLATLDRLVRGNKIATAIVLAGWTALVVTQVTGASSERRWRRPLFAILLAISCQVLLAAKGNAARYAVAGMGSLGACLLLLWLASTGVFETKVRRRVAAVPFLALIAIIGALQVGNVRSAIEHSRENWRAREELASQAQRLEMEGRTLVFGHWASSPVNALYIGDTFADRCFSRLLAEHYPNAFFVTWDGQLGNWESDHLDWRNFLAVHPCGVLQGDSFSIAPVEGTGIVAPSQISRVSQDACPYFVEGLYALKLTGHVTERQDALPRTRR